MCPFYVAAGIRRHLNNFLDKTSKIGIKLQVLKISCILLACHSGGFYPGRYDNLMKIGFACLANVSDPGGGGGPAQRGKPCIRGFKS